MRKNGFSTEKFFSIAAETCAVASVQISMSSWRRSESVMMPRSNCFSIFAARSSAAASASPFIAGVSTSLKATVIPAMVA